MLFNNAIKELYSLNSKLINNDHILNIATNEESYKTGEQYLNITRNSSLIRKENDILWDITLSIPFLDNSVNFIYCEDFFNNLNYDEQTYFLQEALRTLTDNGMLRLSFTPLKSNEYNDLEFNKAIKTIPEKPFINSNDGLISRIKSLGISKQNIYESKFQISSQKQLKNLDTIENNSFIEITKPSNFLMNDIPNIESLVPEVFNRVKPKVSVLYLSYNQSEYITETIEAILQQGYKDFELIWGDDSSTDFTMLYMNKYKNKYPGTIKTPFLGINNVGHVKNLKRTIDIANGEYMAICKADDIWLDRKKLESQLKFMLDHRFDCSSSSIIFKNNSSESILRSFNDKLLLNYQDVLSLQYLDTLSAMMLKKDVFNNTPLGFWDCDITSAVIALYIVLENKLGLGLMNSCPVIRHQCVNLPLSEEDQQASLSKIQNNFTSLFNTKDVNGNDNTMTQTVKNKLATMLVNIDHNQNTTVETDLIIFDDQYPLKELFGWRGKELEYYNNCDEFKTTIMSFNDNKEDFNDKLECYKKYSPDSNIILYNPHRTIKAKLAYLLFLNNIDRALPIIEQNNIPFIFTLYLGGGFSLNNAVADAKLRKVFSSPLFKGVIVTNGAAQKYLLDNNFCQENKIKYIYGEVHGINEETLNNSLPILKSQNQFNICFCAFKYTEKGIDKGYDIFIDVAKILSKIYKDIHFHVVGNFDETEIDCSDIPNIHFYGSLYGDDYFNKILEMHILLSLPRYGKIEEGQYNGFPLNNDFAYVGVPIFSTDELKDNTHYIHDEDIVILDFVPENIASKVEYYYNNQDKLQELSKKCQKKTTELMSDEVLLGARMRILNEYLK